MADLFVLQPTSFCNLNCAYCYVPHRSNKLSLDISAVRKLFRVIQRDQPDLPVRFFWHSGEPLAVGMEFYEDVFSAQREILGIKYPARHLIQTNGTLISEEWCAFFDKYSIDVSVSLDGPEKINDSKRVYRNGTGSFSAVMRGIDLLKNFGIDFQALAVLPMDGELSAKEFVDFFNFIGAKRVGINFEEVNDVANQDVPGQINSCLNWYNTFIQELFLEWAHGNTCFDPREISQSYYALNNKIKDQRYRRKSEEQTAFAVISLDRHGEVSTFSPELMSNLNQDGKQRFSLGSIHSIESFSELERNNVFLDMEKEISIGVEMCRSTCDYFDLCGGGHFAAKYAEHGRFNVAETSYCNVHRIGLLQSVIDGMRVLSNSGSLNLSID